MMRRWISLNLNDKLVHSMKSKSEFEAIPGVGDKISKELIDLGYKNVGELKGENPEVMYQNLIELRGRHIDRCVLYVFRCAVYFTSNSVHDPELLKWWNWKDKKGPRVKPG